MRAGTGRILIAALVLASSLGLFASISVAGDPPGMWHPADEIGPGTFKDGNYAFGLSNINFGPGTNLTGNATLNFTVLTAVPGTGQDAGKTFFYSHELAFPALDYGLYLRSNGTALYVNTTGGIAAKIESSITPLYVYNRNYRNGGVAIMSYGDISMVGDIKPATNNIYNLGFGVRRWNSTYTQWLCLGTPPVCKNTWTGGGSGTAPSLQDVTDVEAVTTHDITTGGLTLMTGKVIHSQDGNVIIRLGN